MTSPSVRCELNTAVRWSAYCAILPVSISRYLDIIYIRPRASLGSHVLASAIRECVTSYCDGESSRQAMCVYCL